MERAVEYLKAYLFFEVLGFFLAVLAILAGYTGFSGPYVLGSAVSFVAVLFFLLPAASSLAGARGELVVPVKMFRWGFVGGLALDGLVYVVLKIWSNVGGMLLVLLAVGLVVVVILLLVGIAGLCMFLWRLGPGEFRVAVFVSLVRVFSWYLGTGVQLEWGVVLAVEFLLDLLYFITFYLGIKRLESQL
jgi:hypothetical protein